MNRFLFAGVMILATFATKGQQSKFVMPAKAQYLQGRVRVKVKAEFKTNFAAQSVATARNLRSTSITPIVNRLLAKKGSSWRGPRATVPIIDIARYFEMRFDPGQNIESFINDLYATGYFEIVEPVYIARTNFFPNDMDSAQQYYLKTIKAFQAWDITQGSEDLTIAIVDSGGDLNHPDLAGNLYVNSKEIPDNGIDDDLDGFIDNYRGWDFIGADTLNVLNPEFKGDNDPSIFSGGDNSHGTWVAGCASASTNNGIGISGVGFRTKLMFTKHSADNESPNEGRIYSGFDGILYAANQGIKIINCSWGSYANSKIEQDMITHVTLDLGCLIVAAAGNNSSNEPLYPASYDNVLSVTATDQNNNRASFASFGTRIDLSAPGVGIFTTSYDNTYASVSGTSFSSPLVAGAAALVWAKYPSYTASQIAELLRVSSDSLALYGANSTISYNFLGEGLLDIQKALTRDLPSLRVLNMELVNASGEPLGSSLNGFLRMNVVNYLQPTTGGLRISIFTDLSTLAFSNTIATPGRIMDKDTAQILFPVTLAGNIFPYTSADFEVLFSDVGYTGQQSFSIQMNKTPFEEININEVTTSIGETGRLAYETAAEEIVNSGDGFLFKNHQLVSEIGLIMGTGPINLYNNVRGINGFDQDFSSIQAIQKITPGVRSDEEIFGEFSNSVSPSEQALIVDYRSLAWNSPDISKFVIVEYKIKNPAPVPISNFFFGMFVDWDISPFNDYADWYALEKTAYIFSSLNDGSPYAGTQLLTGNANHYAIDNDPYVIGASSPPDASFAINEGFTDDEKFTTLSTDRLTAGRSSPFGNDVSHVVASGPHTIGAGQTITVAFALHAAENLATLKSSAIAADSVYNHALNDSRTAIISVFPNPVQNQPLIVEVNQKSGTSVQILVINLLGALQLESEFETTDEINQLQIETTALADGLYIMRIQAGDVVVTKKIIKVR